MKKKEEKPEEEAKAVFDSVEESPQDTTIRIEKTVEQAIGDLTQRLGRTQNELNNLKKVLEAETTSKNILYAAHALFLSVYRYTIFIQCI